MKEDYLKAIKELRDKLTFDNKNINFIELVDILEHLDKIQEIIKK